MLWINFLHFYQPATLDKEIIVEAINKSYLRIINALKKNKDVKFTINIQACLLEKFIELGYQNIVDDLQILIKRGQIEIVGSAAFHPIIPLINEVEITKQIKLQEKIIAKYLGVNKLKGFFMPEMAYSADSAKLIKKMGYEWIILDEISATGQLQSIDNGLIYLDNNSGLKIIFRQRDLSQSYVPHTIADLLNTPDKQTAITATDAELYGLRHSDVSGHLEKLLKNNQLSTQLISEYINKSTNTCESITPVASSWESKPSELQNNIPYALWFNKKNKIQNKIWELASLAIDANQKYKNDPQSKWAQWRLNRGLASCTFWWASGKRLTIWHNRSWNPDEIERGVEELIKSIRALDDTITRLTKIKAEKLYIDIKRLIWNNHWRYFWKK